MQIKMKRKEIIKNNTEKRTLQTEWFHVADKGHNQDQIDETKQKENHAHLNRFLNKQYIQYVDEFFVCMRSNCCDIFSTH